MDRSAFTPNPYAHWAQFSPDRVFGRVRLIQNVIGTITDLEPRSVNLHGPPRIGKTTILTMLASPNRYFAQPPYREAIGGGFAPSRLIPVCVDFQDAAGDLDPHAILTEATYQAIQPVRAISLNAVAEEVKLGTATADLSDEEIDSRAVSLARAASQQGYRLILCMDHVDDLAPLFDRVGLRRLTPLTKFASFVIASRSPLVLLHKDIAESPFSTQLEPQKVGLLSEGAAQRMLSLPSDEAGVHFSDSDKRLLIDTVGTHPYILRQAAQQAYEYLLSAPPGTQLTRMYLDTQNSMALTCLFEYLWLKSEGKLERYLRARMEGNDLRKLMQDGTLYELVRDDLLILDPTDPDEVMFFSPLFESYAMRKLQGASEPADAVPAFPTERSRLSSLKLDPATKEAQLLELLLENSNRVVNDKEILARIWGDAGSGHALETTVSRLRARLRDCGDQCPARIHRHRNRGFALEFLAVEGDRVTPVGPD